MSLFSDPICERTILQVMHENGTRHFAFVFIFFTKKDTKKSCQFGKTSMIILFLSFNSVCELHVLTENHTVKKKKSHKQITSVNFYTLRYLFAPVPLFTKKKTVVYFFPVNYTENCYLQWNLGVKGLEKYFRYFVRTFIPAISN